MFNSRSDVIFTPKKFTWTDFGGIYTHIPPCGYAPADDRLLAFLKFKMASKMVAIS